VKDGTYNLGSGRNRTAVFAKVDGDTLLLGPGSSDGKVRLYPAQLAALRQLLYG